MSNLLLLIILAIPNVYSTTNSTDDDTQETRFIAAICLEQWHLFQCFSGVVNEFWVVTTLWCDLSKATGSENIGNPYYVYADGDRPGCYHGQRRKSRYVRAVANFYILKLERAFELNDKVMVAKLPVEQPPRYQHCKIIHTSTFRNRSRYSRKAGFAQYSTSLAYCNNMDDELCGTLEYNRPYDLHLSPIICQDILYGFLEKINSKAFEMTNIARFSSKIMTYIEWEKTAPPQASRGWVQCSISLFFCILCYLCVSKYD
ncbi:hypothetical protein QE152_g7498 [Popillia japonica]|uniref:Uncharacterized protein n=1 Tax=Popillia japonica TaxID=7064 RepID=A0AAW1MF04_POPJA